MQRRISNLAQKRDDLGNIKHLLNVDQKQFPRLTCNGIIKQTLCVVVT